jgi:hypothetical protein
MVSTCGFTWYAGTSGERHEEAILPPRRVEGTSADNMGPVLKHTLEQYVFGEPIHTWLQKLKGWLVCSRGPQKVLAMDGPPEPLISKAIFNQRGLGNNFGQQAAQNQPSLAYGPIAGPPNLILSGRPT